MNPPGPGVVNYDKFLNLMLREVAAWSGDVIRSQPGLVLLIEEKVVAEQGIPKWVAVCSRSNFVFWIWSFFPRLFWRESDCGCEMLCSGSSSFQLEFVGVLRVNF